MGKTKVHTIYRNDAGKRVPSVTTILGLLDKPGLLYWAWECGVNGLDYRKERDKAGDIGTLAHYLIECKIRGLTPDTASYSQEYIDKAMNGLSAFERWARTVGGVEEMISLTVAIEEQMTCDTFGGTADWIVRHKGKIMLIDFKTSKKIYKEMSYQLAAYQYLWNLSRPDEKIEECYILRLDKESGDFEFKNYGDLSRELELFLYLQKVYELRKVKK